MNNECTKEESVWVIDTFSAEDIDEETMVLLNECLSEQSDDPSHHQSLTHNLQLIKKIINHHSPSGKIVHRVHLLKTAWFRYAAVLILIFGIGAYLWNTHQKEKPLITSVKPSPKTNDIPPGFNRAILTLSDGQKVELDSAVFETITDQNIFIQNNNGQVSYVIPGPGKAWNPGSLKTNIAYNTMTTPKGGQYQLTLADGTRVWLNAASSLTYPTTFTMKTREVKITGEAYFEVHANPVQPFIVKTNTDIITVLGTEFNINSYTDETATKTSLINGRINVNDTNIKPGQAYQKGKVSSTNTSQDIAWKNGYFNFEGAKLKTVMRQLSRWYNLEIKYEKNVPDITFFGELNRNISLKGVLEMLEGAGVHFTLNGNTLLVKP
jgi:transmembrane sensor